ncbi:hypothetical protein IJV57_02675 [Candidatus Saccharibacteria bacterium]|nr:hypothetical protein [Paludibacteraceae bacterium]MBQ9684356.1 hypothetical protein [Candidatus Saccharibacteria bacterium]
MAEKYSTLCIDDVSRRIGRNTRLFAFLDEHARDNGSIAVFYDDKASYSVMESPYCPDIFSSSEIARKWEHISLCTRCEAENYVSWEVMYTLGPVRNRLSITHYDNGGVTIMPPKGKYVHVIGLKTGDKTHLIVNTDSRKLCDVYGDDGESNPGEYGICSLTEDWMSLSRLTEDAIESYMYECEHDIKHIVLGRRSTDPIMPPILFSRYAYSSFTRNVYISSVLNEFCDKEGLDLIQVCTRVDNDIDEYHCTKARIVIGNLDTTEFHRTESRYAPCSNYLVYLDVSKDDYDDEWGVLIIPAKGNPFGPNGIEKPIISGYID